MSTRQKQIEISLLEKEERISNWEKYGTTVDLLNRKYCEMPKIENWYI